MMITPAISQAQTTGGNGLGGTVYQVPTTPTTPIVDPLGDPTITGASATIDDDGLAVAPAGAPKKVRQLIAAGNKIASKPYVYGGGHSRWRDRGYDCSGSVSYALHGASLLKTPLASGDFKTWGEAGEGEWVTLYTKASHIYMVVAGLRFDTSGRTKDGSRWQTTSRSARGYVVRHPVGL
jgi:cell wall-associated NlpC family hydrolase